MLLGQLLDPVRSVHYISDDGELLAFLRPQQPGEDGAIMQADAEGDGGCATLLTLFAPLADGLQQALSRGQRMHCVLRPRLDCAKDPHDVVTDELVDNSAVALNDPG